MKALIGAAIAAAIFAGHARAEWVCHDIPGGSFSQPFQQCEDSDKAAADKRQQETLIYAYCSHHPDDPDCAARGWRATATDATDQAVDRRLTDHWCEGPKAGTVYCVSPFGKAGGVPK